MNEIDLNRLTYKIDILNASQEAKVVQEKIEILLSEKDKVFEALFGNQQTNPFSTIQHPIMIIEGDANLLHAILNKFKDNPNFKRNFLNSELLNDWVVIHKLEEKNVTYINEEKKEDNSINQMQAQSDCSVIINELKDEIKNLNIDTQSLLKSIGNSINDFSYKDKINKELHEELQNYKAGIREEFVKPILKAIIREYDRTVQLYDFYSQKAETEYQGELFTKLLKEFNIISLGFLDILDDYNLVPYEIHEGDEFSPREHKIIKVVKTDDISKDGKIAKSVKCGFRDTESERLLRQAEVNIYKISNNK